MPRNMVPLEMTVGGRVQGSAADPTNAPGAGSFVYQWPGTYFDAAFRGSKLYLRTGAGRQRVRLVVDGRRSVAFVSSNPSVHRVAGLPHGSHTVRLSVLTEGQAGPEQFYGFAARAQDRLPPVHRRARQMEFIGDSYTVGYGNTSGKSHCSAEEVWSSTDSSVAFGPLTAEHFGADYQVNAISGRGVVRNYNGGKADTLPQAYPFVLFDKKQRYQDADWHPQVIVVGLGTNDFSTALNPGEPWTTRDELHTGYETRFLAFLKSLRKRNPSALLIVWATDGEHGEVQTEAGNVARQLKKEGDAMVAFLPVSGLQMSGCDGHPSAADDQTLSARLREVIETHPDVWHGAGVGSQ